MYLHINGNERDFIAVQKVRGYLLEASPRSWVGLRRRQLRWIFRRRRGRRWRWWGWSRIKFFRERQQ